MAFSAVFIDELIEKNPIEDVVASYVSLTTKSGRLWGLCPFHGEKTPSFTVSSDKQLYYCFGCGKGGGVINFIMDIENLDYPDAVRFLAKRAGLTVPEDGKYISSSVSKTHLYNVNREAARIFHGNLIAPEGAEALAYLTGKRGLKMGTITRFGLGFAPNAWDSMIKALTAKGFTQKEIIDAGLAVASKANKGCYDRFRNRIIFPIIDVAGNVVGFSGRVMDDSQPKYLNSPDTPVFNKSKNLFAINYAKKSKVGRIVLTEGNMDAVMLHQAGIDSAVASCGTALTEEQARLIAKYTDEVVLAYDSDEAGTKATRKAIGILNRQDLRVKVLRMQGAKDPDEFIRKNGAEAFRTLLERSENHVEYRLALLQSQYDLSKDDNKVQYIKDAVTLIGDLNNAVEREVYGGRAAQAAGVSYESIAAEIERAYRKKLKKEKKAEEKQILSPADAIQPKDRTLRYSNIKSARAEQGVLRLLIAEPSLIRVCSGLNAEQFSSPLLGKAFECFGDLIKQGLMPRLSAIEQSLTPEEMQHLASVLQAEQPLTESERAMEDFIGIINTEYEKRSFGDERSLLTLRDSLKKRKGYEDNE